MRLLKDIGYVSVFGAGVMGLAIILIQRGYPVGPIVLGLGLIPLSGLLIVKKSILSAVPDLVFGGIDTGLLAVPAVLGALKFGVVGAIAGGVVGDAVTDAIAGFFEGGIARWLRERGIEESSEPVTSSLGKMAGCLLGAGIVLIIFQLFGITLKI